MFINLKNLRSGYTWWMEKSGWPGDLHNSGFYEIYSDREKGNGKWLDAAYDRLRVWKAFRPYSKEAIHELRLKGEESLSVTWELYISLSKRLGWEPSIVDLQWEDVEPIYSWAFELKPRSVMFASKACHFLLPKVFFVIDNLGTGIYDYELAWRNMKDEWGKFPEKKVAIDLVKIWIEDGKDKSKPKMLLHKQYPFETSIMELCLVGRRYAS